MTSAFLRQSSIGQENERLNFNNQSNLSHQGQGYQEKKKMLVTVFKNKLP